MLNAYVSWSPDSVIEQAFSVSLDELCLDVSDYAQTALPACVPAGSEACVRSRWLICRTQASPSPSAAFSGHGSRATSSKSSRAVLSLGADVLISNVIGATRLLHNLTLLRLIGIEHNKISVVPEQIDFASEYRYALANLGVNTPVRHAAFCFGGEALVAAWLRQAGKSAEVSRSFWAAASGGPCWLGTGEFTCCSPYFGLRIATDTVC